MLFALLCVATYLGVIGIQALFALGMLFTARLTGVREEAVVAVGMGPRLLRGRLGRCEVVWRLLPLTCGFEMASMDDRMVGELPPHSYRAASPFTKIRIIASGPLLQVLVGWLGLALPVWIGAPQLVAHSVESTATPISPRAMPTLSVLPEAATMPGQLAFARETVGEYTLRLVTFRSLTGWGGMLGFGATTSAVAFASPGNWLTCLGVLSLLLGLMNLLPIPYFTGGAILFQLLEMVTGRPVVPNVTTMLIWLCCCAVYWIFAGRMLLLDVFWLLSIMQNTQ